MSLLKDKSLFLLAPTVLVIRRPPSATASATPDSGPPRLRRTLLSSPSLPSVIPLPTSPAPSSSSRSWIGVNYGVGLAKDPLPAASAFALLNEKGMYRVKIFDHNLDTIKALNSSIRNVEATIGFSTDEMLSLASNTSLALEALQPLQPFDSLIKYIALASEPNESLPPSTLSRALPLALTTLNSALQTLGMRAKVTVPFTMTLLQPPASGSGSGGSASSPPSLGTFSGAWNETIGRVLSVLHQNNAPFMMNIHPYPAYLNELKKKRGSKGKKKGNKKGIPVAFALGTSNSSVVFDGGLEYRSLLDAMYDTVLAALAKAGYPDMPLIIGETGWPTAGAVEATVGNACRYLNQVIARAIREEGTPRRPGQRIEFYVFEAFDESLKPADLCVCGMCGKSGLT